MTTKTSLELYYEESFRRAGVGGSIYAAPNNVQSAGDQRKLQILQALNLPDIESSVVLDYGMGSWGFGCVFPDLKRCRVAMGCDISSFAVECSANIAAEDPALAHAKKHFFVSDGYDIPLEDESVDIVFAGECIEHIEDTPAFLGEISRIMKQGGHVIFTTPNASPYLYRAIGERYGMSVEHVALMTAEEFSQSVESVFTVMARKGYNNTVLPSCDEACDVSDASRWAGAGQSFEDSTSLIIHARKDTTQGCEKVKHVIVEAEHLERGVEKMVEVGGVLTGAVIERDLSISIPVGSLRAYLLLWAHQWSGVAEVSCGASKSEVNLYSQTSGCVRIPLDSEQLSSGKELHVARVGKKDARSNDDEVIFLRVVFVTNGR